MKTATEIFDSTTLWMPDIEKQAIRHQVITLMENYAKQFKVRAPESVVLAERDTLEDAARQFLNKTTIDNTDEIVSKAMAEFALAYSFTQKQELPSPSEKFTL